MIPFETSVVGSLPRPQWVQDTAVQGENGRLTPHQYRELGDKAAGVDTVTDGEWRRLSYMSIIGQRLSGFEPIEGQLQGFKVVSKLSREGSMLVDDLRFLRAHKSHRTKITLPTPYHLCNHRGFEVSASVYPNREDFLADLVDILSGEVADLAACPVRRSARAGSHARGRADQPISPRPGESRSGDGPGHRQPAKAACGAARTALHLCRGNSNREVSGTGGYETLMPFLHDMPCDQIMMEYATPAAGELSALRDFPADKLLGLGVTDVRSETIDSVEQIVERVEEAARYVDADRIGLNPDCGFAPMMQNPIPLDEAYRKLAVQSEAARQLRGGR